MVHVNILLQRIKTETGWRNIALKCDERGRIKWPSGGRFLIEWRKSGMRLREAAGDTPSDALEAQRKKRLEVEAEKTGLKILDESEPQFPLAKTIAKFLADIRTFRKELTWQKYNNILNLYAEFAATTRSRKSPSCRNSANAQSPTPRRTSSGFSARATTGRRHLKCPRLLYQSQCKFSLGS